MALQTRLSVNMDLGVYLIIGDVAVLGVAQK